MNRQRFLLPALLALTVARLLFLPLHELSAVEMHTLESSRSGALWNAGLGPLLPFLVKISMALGGAGGVGLRLFAPLLILGASWALWSLARGMYDATTASWTVVIFNVTPAVNVASVTMTLTTLGLAASIAVLAALRNALHREHPKHLHWWLLGAALALAFFADWRLIMLSVSAAASMALTRRGRRALMKWPVLPILASSMGIALTVFLAWNSENRWAAFAAMPGRPPVTLLSLMLHVILACSPLLLAAFGWCLAESVLRQPMSYAVAFLYAFIWPLITLDILAWAALPWPDCGFGLWLAPVALLLANHSLTSQKLPPRVGVWARWITLIAAALQSCWMLQRGLDKVPGVSW